MMTAQQRAYNELVAQYKAKKSKCSGNELELEKTRKELIELAETYNLEDKLKGEI